MEKKKSLWSGLLALLLVMVIGFYHQSSAEAGELNISVKPIFPDNQVNKNLKYYDLLVMPGQKQTIELEVTNVADHDVTVLITPTIATTSGNGMIDYRDLKAPVNATLKTPFTEIAKMTEKQVLKAQEVKKVPIEISVPQEPFNGMILGGLYIRQQDDQAGEEEKEEEEEGKIEIKNSFSYELTVKLSENEEEVKPELELLDGRGARYNGENVMQGNLQNPQPDILANLKVEARVYKKGGKVPLYKNASAKVNMAPNSNFYYSVPLKELKDGVEKNVAFTPGKYEFEVLASNEQGEWKLRKEFEITKDVADALNNEATEELEYPINWWLWIGVGVAVLLVIIAVIVAIVLLKKKKEREQNKAKGKSKKGSGKKKRRDRK